MNITYTMGKDSRICLGCGDLTRGLLSAKQEGNPFPIQLPMCPHCRNTKSKHQEYEIRLGIAIPQHIFHENGSLPFETLRPQKGVSFWDLDETRQKEIMESKDWIADPKLDGARALLYFYNDQVYLISSRISKKTGTYSDRSGNFPQITGQGNRFQGLNLNGTILDGEVYINKKGFITGAGKTDSTLNETIACMNASPKTAVRLQRVNNAWATFFVFDCLKFKGEDIREKPYYYRRMKAAEAVHLYASDQVEMLPCSSDYLTWEFWYDDLDYEGIVLKDCKAPYYAPSIGARNKGMIKKKRMETYDAIVTDFVRGKAGFEGLVGALIISQLKNGEPIVIGAVSNIHFEERKLMSDEEGNLKREYYGKIVEVKAQCWTRTHKLRHCQLMRWRTDKTAQECDYVIR
jgi:ATP-dependent DNA ligase